MAEKYLNYTANEINALLDKVNNGEVLTAEEKAKLQNIDLANYATTAQVNAKQDILVSGTNIKTINGTSILGSGNITIEGGTDINVDAGLSSASTNPVQNRVIYNELLKKAEADDVYVEVETSTTIASDVGVMTLADEGIAVASVDEYTYTSPNTSLGTQAKAVCVSGGFFWKYRYLCY